MRKSLCHCAVADAKRFFPDVIPAAVLPAEFCVKPDDVAGEINQAGAYVRADSHARRVAVAGPRHVHAMHGCNPARLRDSEFLAHDESIVFKELLIAPAVGQVALVARIRV